MNFSGGSSTCNDLQAQRDLSRSRLGLRRSAGGRQASKRRPGENPGHLTSESTAPFLSGGRSVLAREPATEKSWCICSGGHLDQMSCVTRQRPAGAGSSPARCTTPTGCRLNAPVTGERPRAGARPALIARWLLVYLIGLISRSTQVRFLSALPVMSLASGSPHPHRCRAFLYLKRPVFFFS